MGSWKSRRFNFSGYCVDIQEELSVCCTSTEFGAVVRRLCQLQELGNLLLPSGEDLSVDCQARLEPSPFGFTSVAFEIQ